MTGDPRAAPITATDGPRLRCPGCEAINPTSAGWPILHACHACGRPFSNANGILQRMFDRVGLTPYFHAICDSCVEGVEKPDPRFFRIVLERAGGRPETAMHVGDLYHVDVLGARRAGIRPLLLDPHGLYERFDVPRIHSLAELVSLVTTDDTKDTATHTT